MDGGSRSESRSNGRVAALHRTWCDAERLSPQLPVGQPAAAVPAARQVTRCRPGRDASSAGPGWWLRPPGDLRWPEGASGSSGRSGVSCRGFGAPSRDAPGGDLAYARGRRCRHCHAVRTAVRVGARTPLAGAGRGAVVRHLGRLGVRRPPAVRGRCPGPRPGGVRGPGCPPRCVATPRGRGWLGTGASERSAPPCAAAASSHWAGRRARFACPARSTAGQRG